MAAVELGQPVPDLDMEKPCPWCKQSPPPPGDDRPDPVLALADVMHLIECRSRAKEGEAVDYGTYIRDASQLLGFLAAEGWSLQHRQRYDA